MDWELVLDLLLAASGAASVMRIVDWLDRPGKKTDRTSAANRHAVSDYQR